FFLLLVQGAAGSSRGPQNERECKRHKGFCSFLKCPLVSIYKGKCSRFYACCKR
ncbi:AMP1 protein, partial [Rhinopomastus cyanomelas]|nr:AMP1 protein [Rhinopomastus cyanomelas]